MSSGQIVRKTTADNDTQEMKSREERVSRRGKTDEHRDTVNKKDGRHHGKANIHKRGIYKQCKNPDRVVGIENAVLFA